MQKKERCFFARCRINHFQICLQTTHLMPQSLMGLVVKHLQWPSVVWIPVTSSLLHFSPPLSSQGPVAGWAFLSIGRAPPQGAVSVFMGAYPTIHLTEGLCPPGSQILRLFWWDSTTAAVPIPAHLPQHWFLKFLFLSVNTTIQRK